jgi:hypothetical protein
MKANETGTGSHPLVGFGGIGDESSGSTVIFLTIKMGWR